MKKIIFILFAAVALFSCEASKKEQKEYKFLVYYFNQGTPSKTPDTLKWIGYGENRFFLKGGDLVHYRGGESMNETLISGVCRFEVFSIKKINGTTNSK